jgi:hypothetical protein
MSDHCLSSDYRFSKDDILKNERSDVKTYIVFT